MRSFLWFVATCGCSYLSYFFYHNPDYLTHLFPPLPAPSVQQQATAPVPPPPPPVVTPPPPPLPSLVIRPIYSNGGRLTERETFEPQDNYWNVYVMPTEEWLRPSILTVSQTLTTSFHSDDVFDIRWGNNVQTNLTGRISICPKGGGYYVNTPACCPGERRWMCPYGDPVPSEVSMYAPFEIRTSAPKRIIITVSQDPGY